ncbi:MAG: hypothetical protein IK095_08100, partial [Oscillospiraceae bacterium]|nr:hypothetical protein [Oscillospiraceae bacterium]
WGVVGTINGWGETADIALTETDLVESMFPVLASEPIDLTVDDEIKVRQGAEWTNNFGATGKDGDNIKVEEDGKYIVIFIPATGAIGLIKDGEDAINYVFEGEANWGVVGTINGWGETEDLPMTAEEVGLFKSEPIELKAGDEIKVRLNGAWDFNYGTNGPGGDNLKVEEDGSYIVILDLANGTVTIEKA